MWPAELEALLKLPKKVSLLPPKIFRCLKQELVAHHHERGNQPENKEANLQESQKYSKFPGYKHFNTRIQPQSSGILPQQIKGELKNHCIANGNLHLPNSPPLKILLEENSCMGTSLGGPVDSHSRLAGAGSPGSILGQGTASYAMPQLGVCMLQLEDARCC